MRILILFGSQSDHSIFTPLQEGLNQIAGSECDLAILSAHRNPDELAQRLGRNDFDLIVAGAGIAAHLPGVVASQVKVPVIGIPVNSYFSGLDAFASILQMPFPIPVLTVGVDKVDQVISFIRHYGERDLDPSTLKSKTIDLLIPPSSSSRQEVVEKELGRMEDYAATHKIKLNPTNTAQQDRPTIKLLSPSCSPDKGLTVNLPIVTDQERGRSDTLIQIMQQASSGGVWVGANNGRNAIVSCQQLFFN